MKHIEDSDQIRLDELMRELQQRVLRKTTWFGVPALQSATDFWTYQEILYERQPDYLVEIGNFAGGSTLAFAHLFDLLGKGEVIALDLDHKRISPRVREHPRISLLEGDACELHDQVAALITPGARVMIIEDSAHTYDNTLNILETYQHMVTVGDYFIIEDSVCRHGLDEGPEAPNAYEAIETFLERTDMYECDRERESFVITWNPKGFLRRVK